jgi:hypothetical protein
MQVQKDGDWWRFEEQYKPCVPSRKARKGWSSVGRLDMATIAAGSLDNVPWVESSVRGSDGCDEAGPGSSKVP